MSIIETKCCVFCTLIFVQWDIIMDNDLWMKNHLVSDNIYNMMFWIYKVHSYFCFLWSENNARFTFSVGDPTHAVYDYYWATQIELVILSTIFSLIWRVPCVHMSNVHMKYKIVSLVHPIGWLFIPLGYNPSYLIWGLSPSFRGQLIIIGIHG